MQLRTTFHNLLGAITVLALRWRGGDRSISVAIIGLTPALAQQDETYDYWQHQREMIRRGQQAARVPAQVQDDAVVPTHVEQRAPDRLRKRREPVREAHPADAPSVVLDDPAREAQVEGREVVADERHDVARSAFDRQHLEVTMLVDEDEVDRAADGTSRRRHDDLDPDDFDNEDITLRRGDSLGAISPLQSSDPIYREDAEAHLAAIRASAVRDLRIQ